VEEAIRQQQIAEAQREIAEAEHENQFLFF